MGKYDDILPLSRPVSAKKHPPMARADRAKQFMPFAALKGYDEAIAEKQVIWETRLELGEEQRDILDARLQRLRQALERGERPRIAFTYFVPRPGDAALGRYRRAAGTAEKMNLETQILRVDGVVYPLREITALECV